MTLLMLETFLVPARPRADRIPKGKYYADEVRAAEARARPWGSAWFTDREASAWLRVHPFISAATARALVNVGISPNDAHTRLWYGRVLQDRPSLAHRVQIGDITAEEAARQLAEFRQAGPLAS